MADLTSKTYYEILGVSPDATSDEIKEAYKQIARAYHPDSNFYDEILESTGKSKKSEPTPEGDTYKVITDAYNTLINEERRKEYDNLFPKGLRDWDDIERNVQATEVAPSRGFGAASSTSIYRPRGETGTFKRSRFGVVEPTNEPAVEKELRGRSITPIEIPTDRNIVGWFLGLLFFGFVAGGILAYLVVSRS